MLVISAWLKKVFTKIKQDTGHEKIKYISSQDPHFIYLPWQGNFFLSIQYDIQLHWLQTCAY